MTITNSSGSRLPPRISPPLQVRKNCISPHVAKLSTSLRSRGFDEYIHKNLSKMWLSLGGYDDDDLQLLEIVCLNGQSV